MLIKLATAFVTTIGMTIGGVGNLPHSAGAQNSQLASVVTLTVRTSSVQIPQAANIKNNPAAVLLWLGRIAITLSKHASQQAAKRGVSNHLIKQTIRNGKKTRGNQKGTSVYTQGKGKNKIQIVVNDKTGKIITVIKGK